MKNLVTIINKEMEKGVAFVTPSGDLYTAEQKANVIKRDCINFLKKNNFSDLEKFKEGCESTYTPLADVVEKIRESIDREYFLTKFAEEGAVENADD